LFEIAQNIYSSTDSLNEKKLSYTLVGGSATSPSNFHRYTLVTMRYKLPDWYYHHRPIRTYIM